VLDMSRPDPSRYRPKSSILAVKKNTLLFKAIYIKISIQQAILQLVECLHTQLLNLMNKGITYLLLTKDVKRKKMTHDNNIWSIAALLLLRCDSRR
jgi:hypothetical protein